VIQVCEDMLRRNAVATHATLNALDSIEVLDTDRPPGSPRQQTLLVRCLKTVSALSVDNVQITGRHHSRPVNVVWIGRADAVTAAATSTAERAWYAALPAPARVLVVRTDSPGDFSRYMLRLIDPAVPDAPAPSFDPRLSQIEFTFKIECPTDLDCLAPRDDRPDVAAGPDIDYLARDYGTYRRLILDRLKHLVPDWEGRHVADLGVMLAELFAHAGDQLSYHQDAVATEAYLGTARRRVSVRRHARLVDYRLHDGCNARAWVAVSVSTPREDIARADIWFVTRMPRLETRTVRATLPELVAAIDAGQVEVFEPLHDLTLFSAHNDMRLYEWGDKRCRLRRGATHATLEGHFPDLKAGDVLIFEETNGDLSHRHAVRLTSVRATQSGVRLTDPLTGSEITEIAWSVEDALPVTLQISNGLTVVHGNVVLADHGRSSRAGEAPEPLGEVGNPKRFRPSLARGPVTHEMPVMTSAAVIEAMRTDARLAIPKIELTSHPDSLRWTSRADLLSSKPSDRHFVLEVEDDGSARVRFGDDRNGRRPERGMTFTARYRIGNGAAGNVGAEAIAHAVTSNGAVLGVRNPIPASGGLDPEQTDEARRRAPHMFRRQERAVTTDDYASMTARAPGVQRAAARRRWTGSWHTMFIAVDRTSGAPLTDAVERDLRHHIDRYRMAGHDVEFDNARFVPLELELHVCVNPRSYVGHVRAALSRALAALFAPDRLTFGQTVYLSPIYSTAHGVEGVDSAEMVMFQRRGFPESLSLKKGRLEFGRLEIPQLDNDPSAPDRGVLTLVLRGGKR
jgi:hypothetical protein